jgi:hypothetical protein
MNNLPILSSIHDRMIVALAEIEDLIHSIFNPIVLSTSDSRELCEDCHQIADTNLEYTMHSCTGVLCRRCFEAFKGELATFVKHVHI